MRRIDSRLTSRVLLMVIASAGLALWEALGYYGALSPSVLPRPSAIAYVMAMDWKILTWATAVTAAISLLGLIVGALAALAIALTTLRFSPLNIERSLFFLAGYESLPKLALAPIFVLWLGVGMPFKVALAASMTLFPFALMIYQAAGVVHHPVVEAIAIRRPKKAAFIRLVLWPLVRPHVSAGIRLAAPAALVGSIVAEYISSEQGLGHVMLLALGSLDAELLFACVGLTAVLGGLFQWFGAALFGPNTH